MTDTIAVVDADTALELLAAAVELAGADHTVDMCAYTRNVHGEGRQPCCMVGVALSIHGVPLDVLSSWDGAENSTNIAAVAYVGNAPFLTGDAVCVLAVAQDAQDNGKTWGVALDHARTTHARTVRHA